MAKKGMLVRLMDNLRLLVSDREEGSDVILQKTLEVLTIFSKSDPVVKQVLSERNVMKSRNSSMGII